MWRTSALRKLRALPWADRHLLAEAAGWLSLVRIAIWLVPFRQIVSWLHLTPGEGGAELEAAQLQTPPRIGWAISVTASRTPWPSTCLVQALAGLIMLKRRGIPATLYLGVAKNAADPTRPDTHAWLRAGSTILTGATGHERFSIIATFTTSR